MKLKLRRFIVIIFVTAFLISAPALLLYSIGYRFDFKKQKIESIGALFLDSNPSDVNVYLNDKLLLQKMPAKIVNLLPDSYSVKVEKDGFYPWSKNLEISGKITTFADNIILFKKSFPEIVIQEDISVFKPSPDNSQIVYTVLNNYWEEIWSYNVVNANNLLLYRTSLVNKEAIISDNVDWNINGTKILVNNKNSYFVLDTKQTDKILLLNDIVNMELQKIKWDSRNPNILYGIDNKNIYKLNLGNLSFEKIITLLIPTEKYELDYLIKNGEIYYLNQGEHKIRLEKIQTQNIIPQYILEADYASDYRLESFTENIIGLISEEKNIIYLLQTNGENPTYEKMEANTIQLNNAKNKFLLYNDFELWTKEMDEQNNFSKKYLLTRHSKGIKDAVWHGDSEYIIYCTDESINAIELDGRDKRNNYILFDKFKINGIAITPDSTFVYFFGENQEGKIGIYKLEIMAEKNLMKQINI